MGANIMNNSWGGGGFSQLLLEAIRRAEKKGILFVAAAGNDGVNAKVIPHYPSSYELSNIIRVAATDRTDALASFSNFGSNVDIAAPGVDILSCMPGGGYQLLSGTSMATPHVAGALALLLSKYPTSDYRTLKTRLLANTTPVVSLQGKTHYGRLNVANALADTDAIAPASPGLFQATHRNTRAIRLTWTAPGDDGTAGTAFAYELRVSTAPINGGKIGRAHV